MNRQDPDQAEWRPLEGTDLASLIHVRLQAHYAVQWLARIARAYIPPQSDDGHTSLLWNSKLNALLTQPLKTDICFGVRIPHLVIVLDDGKSTLETLSLAGCSDLETRDWLGRSLSARGFDASALDAPSPYQLPAHAIANGAKYDIGRPQSQALAELAAWFANAELMLSGPREQMRERGFAASPVRCWPHHFDIATSVLLPARNGSDTGSMGVGLSPGDEYYEGPYFYVSVYPEPDPSLLPKLSAGGHWHTHEFTAAVLTWDKVLRAKEQKAVCVDFLNNATAAALEMLLP
jgi:uncharacterized protein DUF5996